MQPELGQMVFGNPTGSHGVPCYVDALISAVLSEVHRVYWNREQEEWNRYTDPEIPGMEFRPYWWGEEDSPEAERPNLAFGDGVEVRWYKYPGRGTSVNRAMAPEEWVAWFDRALDVVCAADPWTSGPNLPDPPTP